MNWSKLGSRKFWVTAISIGILYFLKEAGADEAIIKGFVAIAASYLGAQGLVDFANNWKPKPPVNGGE